MASVERTAYPRFRRFTLADTDAPQLTGSP
jgi:hypothetical protein